MIGLEERPSKAPREDTKQVERFAKRDRKKSSKAGEKNTFDKPTTHNIQLRSLLTFSYVWLFIGRVEKDLSSVISAETRCKNRRSAFDEEREKLFLLSLLSVTTTTQYFSYLKRYVNAFRKVACFSLFPLAPLTLLLSNLGRFLRRTAATQHKDTCVLTHFAFRNLSRVVKVKGFNEGR